MRLSHFKFNDNKLTGISMLNTGCFNGVFYDFLQSFVVGTLPSELSAISGLTKFDISNNLLSGM